MQGATSTSKTAYVKIPIASTGGAPLAPTVDVAVGVGTRF
jgi:hypothetical protein